MDPQRADYADGNLPPPPRAARWLLAVAVGVVTFVGVLLLAVQISRAVPVKSDGTTGHSRDDFAEVIRALEIRAAVAAGVASLVGTVAGIVAFRRTARPN